MLRKTKSCSGRLNDHQRTFLFRVVVQLHSANSEEAYLLEAELYSYE